MTRFAQVLLVGLGLIAPAVAAAQVPATPWQRAMAREAHVLIGRVRGPAALPRAVSGGTPGATPDAAWRAAETMLRDRVSQLHFCYTEFGLRTTPTLTGTVMVTFQVNASRGTDSVTVRPVSSDWEGAAADQVTGCLRRKLLAWRWPDGLEQGRYHVPLAFVHDPAP